MSKRAKTADQLDMEMMKMLSETFKVDDEVFKRLKDK